MFSPPKLLTVLEMPGNVRYELPLNVVLRLTPASTVASSANGFIVEPTSYCACVALLSCLVR